MILLNINGTFITIVFIVIGVIMLGPPLMLGFFGRKYSIKGNKEQSQIYYILAVVYLIISFGSCGSIMFL